VVCMTDPFGWRWTEIRPAPTMRSPSSEGMAVQSRGGADRYV
jgi:hypothetical protein